MKKIYYEYTPPPTDSLKSQSIEQGTKTSAFTLQALIAGKNTQTADIIQVA